MRKTMKRIVVTAIVLILLAGIACVAVMASNPNSPLHNARITALNTVIDATGIKDHLRGELETRAKAAAEEYGIPQEVIDEGIDMLAIEDWRVVDNPDSTTINKTVEMDINGSLLQVTTYDDESVISIKGEGNINTFGQTISFSVPESARGLSNLLPYIEAAEELGIPELADSLKD